MVRRLRQTLTEWPGSMARVFVTKVPVAAELVTRTYAGRAASENRIQELKEDLSLAASCLQLFEATDAAFQTGCVLYNPLMGFRETVLLSRWFARRLRAIRDRVFLVGADLIPKARSSASDSQSPREERADFLGRLRTLSHGLPIAVQLNWDLAEGVPPTSPHFEPADLTVPTLGFTPHEYAASLGSSFN